MNAVGNIEDVVNYLETQIKALGIRVVELEELDNCRDGVSLFLTGGESFDGVCGKELEHIQNLVIQLKGDKKALNTLKNIQSIRQAIHNVHDITENTTEIVVIKCQPYVSINRNGRTDYSMVTTVNYK